MPGVAAVAIPAGVTCTASNACTDCVAGSEFIACTRHPRRRPDAGSRQPHAPQFLHQPPFINQVPLVPNTGCRNHSPALDTSPAPLSLLTTLRSLPSWPLAPRPQKVYTIRVSLATPAPNAPARLAPLVSNSSPLPPAPSQPQLSSPTRRKNRPKLSLASPTPSGGRAGERQFPLHPHLMSAAGHPPPAPSDPCDRRPWRRCPPPSAPPRPRHITRARPHPPDPHPVPSPRAYPLSFLFPFPSPLPPQPRQNAPRFASRVF